MCPDNLQKTMSKYVRTRATPCTRASLPFCLLQQERHSTHLHSDITKLSSWSMRHISAAALPLLLLPPRLCRQRHLPLAIWENVRHLSQRPCRLSAALLSPPPPPSESFERTRVNRIVRFNFTVIVTMPSLRSPKSSRRSLFDSTFWTLRVDQKLNTN